MTDPRYPLLWPAGWQRTPLHKRLTTSQFKVSEARALQDLLNSLRLLGARDVVVSTNLSLRLDGLPYANQRVPEDAGVSVYFTRKSKELSLACDKYRKVGDNYRSLGLCLEGIRAIERSGSSDLLERAFTGYAALPAAGTPPSWRAVLGLYGLVTAGDAHQRFRELSKVRHPDGGGTEELFVELCAARDSAIQEITTKGFAS